MHLVAAKNDSIAIAAITLALIGGCYFGFAARASGFGMMLLELLVAVCFGAAALAGLLLHWSAIPLGQALHAIWDLVHHRRLLGALVPGWYIPFCAVFDLFTALFLVIIYAL